MNAGWSQIAVYNRFKRIQATIRAPGTFVVLKTQETTGGRSKPPCRCRTFFVTKRPYSRAAFFDTVGARASQHKTTSHVIEENQQG